MAPLIGISAETGPVVRYWGTEIHHVVDADYVAAVRAAGGQPVVLPVGEPEAAAELVTRLDGLVLTGGDDVDPAAYGQDRVDAGTGGVPDPARDRFDAALVHAALKTRLPTLAICRGLQVVNVALGGTLVQHLDTHPTTAPSGEGGHRLATVDPTSLLARHLTPGSEVNSYHHQAVDQPGQGVAVVARAPDGVVEAIEVAGADHLLAVQWHPELLRDRPEHLGLFAWLVSGASASANASGVRAAVARFER